MPAFGIADLVNNIKSSIDGLIADFKGSNPDVVQYHQGDAAFLNVQAFNGSIQASNWSKLSFPYTFSIIKINSPEDHGGFSDFSLPLAPQAISQKEEPAISIKASQGGTTINHNGLGYKTLNIQGTTGVAPFRGEGGVDLKTGEAIFQPKALKFKSGYEVFLHLRNWFRTYYEWKKVNGKSVQDYRLLFKNYKDGEFLVVELLSFEMERQAARSFLYDYKIEFQVLSHFQFSSLKAKTGFLEDTDSFLSNALNKVNKARGVFLRTQGILRQVESTYSNSVLEPLRQTTLALKAAKGVPNTAADVGSRVINNTVSSIKALSISAGILSTAKSSPETSSLLDSKKGTLDTQVKLVNKSIEQRGSSALSDLGGLLMLGDAGLFPPEALEATAEEQESALQLSRSFYEQVIANLERVKKNAEDFFNLGSQDYDDLFERTSTLNADPLKIVTDDEYDMLFAFNESITAIRLMLSVTDLFKSTFEARIKDMNDRFNGNLGLLSSQAVKQIKLVHGITLERLAQQELGDSTRWGELVELNDLKAPYVSEDANESRDGVLKPGDNILIPIPLQNGFSQIPAGKENKLTKGMSELEKSLGTDLKIDKNFDLIISSSGDLELIAGADNMAQGTILKLSYEPGEVILYPQLGAGVIPGRKFPPVEEIKDRVTSTLLQDNRIQRVADLSLMRDNSGLSISFNLHIKQIDIPIPVKIKV